MQFSLSENEQDLLNTVAKAGQKLGMDCYAIGGFVRDKILGRPTKDIDIVCLGDGLLLAQEVAQLLPQKLQVNYFKTYGTAQIKLPWVELEFVGARKESYTQDSRNPVVEPGTLMDDLRRRDFSINALAISLNKNDYGQLIDMFNGIKHLNQKLIITPTEPEKTFSDDPLRMLRAIRFAAQLQFAIEPYTLASIAENAHRISIITQERITTEINKIMLSKKPSIGFYLLDQVGLLKIIFPQLTDLKGVDNKNGRKHKDNFIHTLQVLDNICKNTQDLWLRWAALLHDIAKPATKQFDAKQGWTFHGHETLGAKMVPRIFTKLKLPLGAEMRFVQKLVLLHLRPISLTKANITDSAIRRLLFEAGADIDALMMLCHADITSKDENKVNRYKENFEMVKANMIQIEENDKMRNWQPPITGAIIMETFGLNPCKEVGVLKMAVREAILDGLISNDYQEAMNYLLSIAAAQNLKPISENN